MNLILPIAGQSSRYENIRPKWLLTHPNGNLMLTESITGLPLKKFKNIIIIALEEHEKKYKFSVSLKEELKHVHNLKNVNIVLIDESSNQPETIYKGLKKTNLSDGIFIKDCDNYFQLKDISRDHNSVSVYNLHNNSKLIAGNKSYVQLGSNGTIVNIIEKQVVSNLFCCGGYYFQDISKFLSTFEELKDYDNLYLSHIIYKQILDGDLFFSSESQNYTDWGTLEDWKDFTSQYKVLFVDIDGVIVNNSAKHFAPKWGHTSGITENIEVLNELYSTNKCQIILTTARTEKCRSITKSQLKECDLKYHKLIMGLFHGKRYLINDFSSTNSYPSAIAINLKRNSNNLKDFLKT